MKPETVAKMKRLFAEATDDTLSCFAELLREEMARRAARRTRLTKSPGRGELKDCEPTHGD